MDQEAQRSSKQLNIVKIIFLRKLLRENQKNWNYSFQKIGLGNVKYEISPNFAYDHIKVYKTFLFDSCILYEYDIKKQKVDKSETKIEIISSNQTRVSQINQNSLIISGGSYSNRLTFYNLDSCEESQMKFQRGMHGVAFNKEYIFFLSGYNTNSCEMINLNKSQNTIQIQDMFQNDQSIRGFGANIKMPYVYAFGGNHYIKDYINKIRRFQIKDNQ